MLTNSRTAQAISACLGLYTTTGERQYASLRPLEAIRRRNQLTDAETRELMVRVQHTIALLGKVPVTAGILPRCWRQSGNNCI